MTNKEKAIEIASKHERWNQEDDESYGAYKGAIEMAEWKERQMIQKACDWLEDMACYYAHWEYNGDTYEKEIVFDTKKFIEDFQKAMEEARNETH